MNPLHHKLILILTAFGCLAFGLVTGCLNSTATSEKQEHHTNSATIQTKDEFEAAVMADRALLHIDVDWSSYAVKSRPVITKFFESVEKEFGVGYVSFYRVDCTEQSGPIWDITADWFTKNKADSGVMSSGYGAIVWIKKGQVTDSIHDAASNGIADLMARTRKAFVLAKDESATASR